MYKLQYFRRSQTGICADDFKNEKEIDTINLKFLLSLSDLQKFETPISGRYIGKFALVTMSNNDKYYIDENSFADLSEELSNQSELKRNTMKPTKENSYLDLSKCSKEEQQKAIALLPEPIKSFDYMIDSEHFYLHFNKSFSYPRWYVDFEYCNKNEITFTQFCELFQDEKAGVPTGEKERINRDGTLYIGEGLEGYYKDQLERTGKFKVLSSKEVLQVENNGWIKIEDEFPEYYKWVILHLKDQTNHIAYYDKYFEKWCSNSEFNSEPTHWQPEPKNPKF